MSWQAKVILEGHASGTVLRMTEPFSFWGGVDPASGTLTDPHQAHCGERVAGTILLVPQTRGSSSSSAVLLELLKSGQAPAAIVLGEIDAIVGLGILVAKEMGWTTIPLLVMPAEMQATLTEGESVLVQADGLLVRQPR